MPQSGRRLAAIMFTDMVGYSALTQQDEHRALATLRKHNQILRPIFSRYKGRVVKTMGDAFLVEFGSALEAAKCSVEMQKILRRYNSKAIDKIPVRIGIHVGDVLDKKGDVFGDAVNIASRIVRLADGGEICISEQAYDQIRNKIRFPLVKLRSQNLKNITFPIDIYKIGLPWSPRKASTEEVAPKAAGARLKSEPGEHRAVGRHAVGRFILKLTMKDRMTIVKLTNDSEIPKMLSRFSEAVDYGRGETLHIVSAVEAVSMVIDSKNLEKLLTLVPKKNVLEIYPNLSEIIISLPQETILMPGVNAAISGELAQNDVNVMEYFGTAPQSIVMVDQKDALRSYQLLQGLTLR